MVVVGHGDVPAAASVLVFVVRVGRVADGRALVDVPVVCAVEVSVVHVVDVIAVRNGNVPAALLVPVIVGFVGAMLGGGRHDVLPMRIERAAACSAATAALPNQHRVTLATAHAERRREVPAGTARLAGFRV
jgi:hypothetical protein